jgi:hypothetical protein
MRPQRHSGRHQYAEGSGDEANDSDATHAAAPAADDAAVSEGGELALEPKVASEPFRDSRGKRQKRLHETDEAEAEAEEHRPDSMSSKS